jgi:HEAT repeat protein
MNPSAIDERVLLWLARDARSPQREIKETALDRLGSLPDSTEILVASLADPDAEVRGTAAANLGRVRRANAWPPLVRAVSGELSDEALYHIVGALDGYYDPTIVDVLLELLARRDREYQIRLAVVVQLWKYEPVVARPKLVEVLLGDDNEIVRAHAADSLELLDEVLPPDPGRDQFWLRLLDDDTPGVAKAAKKALHRETAPVADVLAALSRRLQHSATEVRGFALHRLSMLAPASAASLAIPLLDDEQHDVRIECCACLGAIRDPAAISPLLAAFRSDPDPRVQTAALLGLENYHTAEIGNVLLGALETETLSGGALMILCRQLWKYPSARTVTLLRSVLGSSVKLSDRPLIESTLSFLERFATSDPLSPP